MGSHFWNLANFEIVNISVPFIYEVTGSNHSQHYSLVPEYKYQPNIMQQWT